MANLLYINVAGDHPLPSRDVLKIAAQGAQLHAVADEAAALSVLENLSDLKAVVANSPLHSVFSRVRIKFPKARTLLVTAHPMKVYSAALNNEEEVLLDHVIANRSGTDWTINELRITLQKILTADVFGIEKYLTLGAKIFSRTVKDSEQREELNSEVMRFAEECRLGTHISKMIFGICEELLMNAIYDAPVAAGKRFVEDMPRTTAMVLQPDEYATLKYGCDGFVFAVGISDPFGKMTQQKLGQYVKKVLQRRDSSNLIDTKKGGAGLGLFKILYSCHSLVCNVKPDVQTEIISLIDVTEQLRDFAKMARSIHYFNAE